MKALAAALLCFCAAAARGQDLSDVSARQLKSRQGPGAVSGRAVDGFDKDAIPLKSCSASEGAMLRETAAAARDIAAGCLIGGGGRPGLNPELGQRVMGYLGQGGLKLECIDAKGGVLGYSTQSGAKGRTDVSIVSWPPREVASRKPDDTPWVLFHELLHAVDGEEKLLLSHRIHSQTAAPDGVYSCEYACRGMILDGFAPIRLESFERVSGLVIPETPVPCRAEDPGQCSAVRKFATICKRGPVRTDQFKERETAWSAAFCALLRTQGKTVTGKKVKPCTEQACLDLLDPALSASQRQGDIQHPFVAALERLETIADAADRGTQSSLEPNDRALSNALVRAGVFPNCLGDGDQD